MNVLVTVPLLPEHCARLEKAAPGWKFIYKIARELTEAELREADILIGRIYSEQIPLATRLRWIQFRYAGVDFILDDMPAHILLTNTSGAFGASIAEHCFGVLLCLYRKLPQYMRAQSEHAWIPGDNFRLLNDSTALLVGAGDIGAALAERLKAFRVRTVAVRRDASRTLPCFDEVYTLDALDSLLPRADVVFLSLPATPQTAGLMNRERLALMKPDAFLLNMGRGPAVDSMALCEALKAGKLGGAALDVTDPEPLPADHPLWDAPNLIITPHVAALNSQPAIQERIVRIYEENLRRYFNGEPLLNVINLSTGYRETTPAVAENPHLF